MVNAKTIQFQVLGSNVVYAFVDSEAREAIERIQEMLGENGRFYTPTVSADGVLSWTASAPDMPAVPSVNIKGAQGTGIRTITIEEV